jgi:hypothetical protein
VLSATAPVAGWGILEWMRRQTAAATSKAPPTLAEEHGDKAILQIGSRRPASVVMVKVPTDPEMRENVKKRFAAIEAAIYIRGNSLPSRNR